MKRNLNISVGLSIIIILCLVFLSTHAEALSYGVTTKTKSASNIGAGYDPLAGNGLIAIVSSSIQANNESATESAEAAVYGTDSSSTTLPTAQGMGIEPMAFAHAETAYFNSQTSYLADALAGGTIDINHRLRITDNAPTGDWTLSIPMFLHYSMSTSGGQGVLTSATFGISSSGFNYGLSAENGKSRKGTLSFNSQAFDTIKIGVSAGVYATYYQVNDGNGNVGLIGGSGTAVSDPFLFVDPLFYNAQYVVVEQESSLYHGNWVQVTRVWQDPPSPVPEPTTILLFGSGLVGLIGFKKKFKK